MMARIQKQFLHNSRLRWAASFFSVTGVYLVLILSTFIWQARPSLVRTPAIAAIMLDLIPSPEKSNALLTPSSTPPKVAPPETIKKTAPVTPPPKAVTPAPLQKPALKPLHKLPENNHTPALAPKPIAAKPSTPVSTQSEPKPTHSHAEPSAVQAKKTEALSQRSAPSTSQTRAAATWQSNLLAHIERYKRYPRQARRRGLEAVIYVRVVIDKKGRVIQHQLSKPSQYHSLNREVMALITRAQPLPAPPHLSRDTLSFVLPVTFSLKR